MQDPLSLYTSGTKKADMDDTHDDDDQEEKEGKWRVWWCSEDSDNTAQPPLMLISKDLAHRYAIFLCSLDVEMKI